VRYLMTTKGGGPAPDQQLFEDMAKLIDEFTRSGTLVATGGLDLNGTRVTASGGRATFTDGPFTDSKETIVSFALVEVQSEAEVRELSRRFWAVVKEGEGDFRRVYGPGE
jgi:hypothetical protein